MSFTGCGDDGGPSTGDDDAGTTLDTVPTQIQRYIRSDTDTRLLLEVDYVGGYAPYPDTGAKMASSLADALDKPDGIELQLDEVIAGKGDQAWTRSELHDLAESTNDLQVPDGTVTIHVLFVDGQDEHTSSDGTVLGLAWNNLHVVIYKKSIEDSCSGLLLGQQICEAAEASILLHEIGHTIGLVNNGIPMVTDHADPEHPAHDTNDQCIMYWAYEGDDVLGILQDRLVSNPDAVVGFDQACLEDIAAVRNAE